MTTPVLDRLSSSAGRPTATGVHRPAAGRLPRSLAFLVPLSGYITVAVLLAVRYHSYFGDAQAREANGYYVFFGRNPHLAAIGFVWNPGMSIADMPLMWLSGIFPALTHEMLAAGLTSALAMAGACYQFYRFMEEQGVRSMTRWLLLACFAVNPMIITYGGDGMSEALFILCLVASSRYLATWLRNRGARSLVTAGAWMGLAYMVRNEAVGAAGLATLLVGGATFLRERMLPTKMRRMAAATDMIVYVLPFVVAFAGWALVSWVIVGHPFEQYQSAYGTASQLKFLGLDHEGGSKVAHFEYVGQAMLLAAPLVLVLAAAVLARARRIGDPAVLGVIATLGGVCVFELAAYTTGQISWAFRYVIYVIPFAAMLAGSLSSSIDAEANGSAPWRLVAAGRRLNWSMSAMAAFVLLLPGLVTTGYTEMVSSVDPLDQQVLQWIVLPHDAASKRWEQFEHEWVSTDKMAQALDAMHLRSGELMVDTEEPCIPNLILESTNASQFFVPNDSDFKGKIGSPYTNGVRYLMVSSPQGYGSVDAINVQYPSLYADGAGIATLAATFTPSYCPAFRLYKLSPVTQ